MCGIVGAVGKSKNISLSYAIFTALLEETESRGSDATGFYAYHSDNTYNYYKLNIPATAFVKTQVWKDQQTYDFTHLIAHARMKTHGTELEPINNHPHVSEDHMLAVVHNGIIMAYNSIANRNNIKLLGECDSEILLKLVETTENPKDGVERIFKEMKHSYASMACLMIDLRKGHNQFYAFRNNMSPICFIDLSQELGQYFFCSTEFIWKKTLAKLNLNHLEKHAVQSIPAYEIWKIGEDLNIEKIKMDEYQSFTSLSEDFPIANWRERRFSGITRVDYMQEESEDDNDDDHRPFGQEFETLQEVEQKINKIDETLSGIANAMHERSYTKKKINYESLSDQLDEIMTTLNDVLLQEEIDIDQDNI